MTLVVGHRAMGDKETELASFHEAIRIGIDMVEFDLRMTRDRELVVYHGPPGMEGKNILRDKTLDEVSRDLGRRPPLFSEVLEITAGQISLDIEIKEKDIASRILDETRGLDADAFIITSFLDDVVSEVKAKREDVRVGLILGMYGLGPKGRLSEIFPERRKSDSGADFLVAEKRIYKASPTKAAFQDAFLWGINEAKETKEALRNPRVAGVITDCPKRALGIRQNLFVT